MSDIEWHVENRVACITLNAPPNNILTSALAGKVEAVFRDLRSRSDHNVIGLRSYTHTVFSSGADVKEHVGRENAQRMLRAAHSMIAEILRAPVPTVCLVGGACLGGAFEMALAFDQLKCLSNARFAFPEITLGCYPPAAMVLANWKLPPFLSADLIQTGTSWNAEPLYARHAGFELLAISGLASWLEGLASTYAELPRGPLIQATRLLRAGAAERFLAQVGGIEQAYLEQLLQLHDANEGPQAFLEKRKPVWDHKG